MNKPAKGVVFRVASQARVGGGHVSRCLAVARALADTVPVLMVLDPSAEASAARCAEAGIAATDGALDVDAGWGVCVLDGYEFTAADYVYYASVAALAVFDDLGDPAAMASLVINATPGLSGDRWGEQPALLGSRFAPIRPQFAALADRAVPAMPGHVLVTLGRTPAHAEAERVLDAIEAARNHEFDPEVTLILPAAAEAPDSLRRIIDRPSHRISMLESVPDMVAMLAETDLVIGAGGVSLLERMAAGIPSVSIVLADNQRAAIRGAAALGATRACELDDDSATGENLEEAIWRLASDLALRVAMARAGRDAVDDKGAKRIADALIALATEGAR